MIRAGALGNGRDLFVSPQHRMLIRHPMNELHMAEPEVLVAAIHLVNGDSVLRAPCDTVEYFHILLAQHQILFAEGAASESFFAGGEWAEAIPEVADWCAALKLQSPDRWHRAMRPVRPQARRFEGNVLSDAAVTG
jgi:hypothetical protein